MHKIVHITQLYSYIGVCSIWKRRSIFENLAFVIIRFFGGASLTPPPPPLKLASEQKTHNIRINLHKIKKNRTNSIKGGGVYHSLECQCKGFYLQC